MILDELSNISIHSVSMFIFLTYFFFNVSSSIEIEITIRQIRILLKNMGLDFLKKGVDKLTPHQKDLINQKLTELKKNNTGDRISSVNNTIKDKSMKICRNAAILCIIFNMVIFLFSKYFEFNLLTIIIENILIMSFVFLTEYLFTYTIPKNVDIVYPKKILQYLINHPIEETGTIDDILKQAIMSKLERLPDIDIQSPSAAAWRNEEGEYNLIEIFRTIIGAS